MAFWTTQRIESKQAMYGLLSPFESRNLHQGAYELTLSQQAAVTSSEKGASRIRGDPAVLIVSPGQFAVLYSHEVVRVPADAIAFISVKSSYKGDGLINISGFHVDPGYKGQLRFSVYNAGSQPVVLRTGSPTFQIWFADMDAPTCDPYQGAHQDQRGLTSEDLRMTLKKPASPTVLAERIGKLEVRLKHMNIVLYGLVVPLYLALLAVVFAGLYTLFQINPPPILKQGTPIPSPSHTP